MQCSFLLKVVGAAGFEPTTLWSQTRCATRLRYAPTKGEYYLDTVFRRVIQCLENRLLTCNPYLEVAKPDKLEMVGAAGFEPTTLWSQTRCATRLRYAPTKNDIYTRNVQACLRI